MKTLFSVYSPDSRLFHASHSIQFNDFNIHLVEAFPYLKQTEKEKRHTISKIKIAMKYR